MSNNQELLELVIISFILMTSMCDLGEILKGLSNYQQQLYLAFINPAQTKAAIPSLFSQHHEQLEIVFLCKQFQVRIHSRTLITWKWNYESNYTD